jgi:hypothetical protein
MELLQRGNGTHQPTGQKCQKLKRVNVMIINAENEEEKGEEEEEDRREEKREGGKERGRDRGDSKERKRTEKKKKSKIAERARTT